MVKKKSKGSAKNIIAVLLLAAVIVSSFAMLANRNKKVDVTPEKLTAVQEVLARNLDTNYPATPKEVLKFYSEVTRCFYSEEYSEEELDRMAKLSRTMLDSELYAQQTEEDYLNDLKIDIDLFHSKNMTISSYSVSSAADVDYYQYENADWAKLNCIFSIRIGTRIESTNEEFLLRKSEDGHWKIFGWRVAQEEET